MDSELLSYNEQENQNLKLRHIFFPSTYLLVGEAILGLLLVIAFNASTLSNMFLSGTSPGNPFSYSMSLLDKMLINLEKNSIFQQAALFILWALVGSLLYILAFKLFWIIYDISASLGSGASLVKREHTSGLISWLRSLHDFFIRALLVLAGICAFVFGTFVCFSVASQELTSSFIYSFPANLSAIIFFIIASILSIRLIMLGLALLFQNFRNWYTDA